MSDSTANPFEVAAWFAAAAGFALAVIQFWFNSLRERRIRRQEQARFGYQLLDQLFDDEAATEVLFSLDSGTWSKRRKTIDAMFRDHFLRAFGKELQSDASELVAVRMQFDALLYHLNRLQHAIDAGLTTFDNVRDPLVWYVSLMREVRPGIEQYARGYSYSRVVRFLHQFEEWDLSDVQAEALRLNMRSNRSGAR